MDNRITNLCCLETRVSLLMVGAFATVALHLCLGSPAWGEVPAKQTVIMIDPGQKEVDVESISDAVTAQLAGLPVEFRVQEVAKFGQKLPKQLRKARSIASREGVVAVFWCDVSEEGELHLYLRGAGDGPTLVRNVASDGGEPVEALAIIVRSSVGALLRGGKIIVEDPSAYTIKNDKKNGDGKANGIKKVTPPLPPVPERTWVRMEGGYRISDVYGQPDQGFQLGLALSFHDHMALFASFAFVLPEKGKNIDTEMEVERRPISLGLRALWPVSWGDFGVSVALTGDYVSYGTSTLGQQTSARGDDQDLVFIVVPAATLRVNVWGPLHLCATPGAEVVINPVRYVIDAPAAQVVLLEQKRVAFWGTAGFAVDLF